MPVLSVAIVGCGKIADEHAAQIRRVAGCRIVAVCDQEPLMARQLAERFAIDAYYGNLSDLLANHRPDVVHVTTPPQSHFALARQCLLAGSHVYVEKPFTVDADDAAALVTLADELGLLLTVGHDDQFRHGARRMRTLIRGGYIGPAPVHMESYYCYEMGGAYAEALLSNGQHWTRTLPGGLLHNIISHGIARVAEYLVSDTPTVIATGFTSPFLRRLGESSIKDELRVIIVDGAAATAYFTFSSQMRPALHAFRVYGARNGVELDQDHEWVVKLRGARYKSYADKCVPQLHMAAQYLRSIGVNAGLFARNRFHMKAGMKHLIESFYQSIAAGAPLPIPYRQILLTARIMDSIFTQLNQQANVGQSVSTLDRPR